MFKLFLFVSLSRYFVIQTKMKRLYLLLYLSLLAFLSSCSTDIDLYSDYKQVPIIYGLLDANADTNFIKITRAFYVQGDAYQSAVNPDSSNYPGKLDVRIIEYCNGDSVREIILDTITIQNKEQGVFYAPKQKMYYTTEPLSMNSIINNYSYKLRVALPDRTLVTTTDLVGNGSYDIQSLAVNFSKEYIGMVPRRFLFCPAINAVFYDVNMSFTFLEQRTPDDDSVPRTMSWYVGTYMTDLLSSNMDGTSYVFFYRPETFYEKLSEFIGGDTNVVGLKRYIDDYPVEVTISAGGEKLRRYIYENDPTNGFVGGDNEFALIDNGYGVFSSRMTIRRNVRLGGETVPDLVRERKWGFKFIGGEPIGM